MRAANKCIFIVLIFCLSSMQNAELLSDENGLSSYVESRTSYGADGGFRGSYAIEDLAGTNFVEAKTTQFL